MFVNETEFVRVIKSAWRSCTLKVQKIEQDGEEKTVGRCFHKVVNLFEAGQVERMV